MSNIIFAIHSFVILLLAIWAFDMSKKLKMPITIHNLPIILLTTLGLCITTWLSGYYPEYFIPTGIMAGAVVFIINSVNIPGQINPSVYRKIFMSVFCVLFWPELSVLFWIVTTHIKKINEKPQY